MRTCDANGCQSISTVTLDDKQYCLYHARLAINLGQPKVEPIKAEVTQKAVTPSPRVKKILGKSER